MERYKTLQYGVSDFRALIQKNRYFVDKTPFIEKMERMGDFLVLLRPRRFGKSLFLSMLGCYYDIKERDHFDTLFKDTWIADNPTDERGIYQVLTLDFSRIGNKSIEDLEESFNTYCCDRVNRFMSRYRAYYPEDVYQSICGCTSFVTKLNRLNDYAHDEYIQLCLLIDEYDNFTNTILASEGHQVYHAITHADGFYRGVFKLFKGMFSRIVLTGVSPVTLDDLTSGFNIARNITLSPKFNQVLGFSTDEVLKMIEYYQTKGLLPAEAEPLMEEMTKWYDGYCFSEEALDSGQKVYNSTMVIHYLMNYMENRCAPSNLLDSNTRMDYTKLHQLLHLDQLNGDRRSVLMEIVQNGCVTGKIESSFPAQSLTDPALFTSLLFYYGMVSITGKKEAVLKLGIPNNNVRRQYYDYLLAEINKKLSVDTKEMDRIYEEAALEGKWREMVEYLCGAYNKYSSIRNQIEGERHVQAFLLAYLSLNPYYLTAPEVEANHGYCDFFLMPEKEKRSNIAHSYIIELKYLSSGDTDAKAEVQWREAVEQIHRYMQAPKVHLLSRGTTLHAIVLQVKGAELYRTEEVECIDLM
jgi:hypothetical protein